MTGEMVAIRPGAASWAPTDAGEIVILDLRTSKYLSLNNTGALLWPLLSEGAGTDDLAALLVDKFGLTPDAAASDVFSFITRLRALDLVAPAE
jgi:hypothetical protein